MNHAAKLKWFYVLTVLLITMWSTQMGISVAHQVRGSELQEVFLTYIVIDMILGYTLIRAGWRIIAQIYLSRKWKKKFRSARHEKLSKRLNYKYHSWNTEIVVVKNEAIMALSIGMRKPIIVVSTAVLEMFSEDEVKAVLLHEWHHCSSRDNSKLFLATLLAESFGYLPIMKPIYQYYRTWMELMADRFAIRRMGTELHLANVLLKLTRLGKVQMQSAAIHFTTTMDYRMMQVLEPDQAIKVKVAWLRPLLASMCILLLLMLGGDS